MRRRLSSPSLLAALLLVALSAPASAHRASGSSTHTGAGGHGSHGKRHAKARPQEIALTLGAGAPGAQVAMAPVGLSLEYSTLASDMGAGSCPPPALATALQQLGSPPLALAGDSQDMLVPSEDRVGPTTWEAATLYPLPAGFWTQLHCLLEGSHDPLTVGLNVKTGPPAWAAQIASAAQGAATSGLSFSLGNEPDLYDLPNYAALGKPQPGEEASQVALYLQLAGATEVALGGAPVVGPELAQPAHWQRELPRVVSQLHLVTLGVHAYPLTACQTPRAVTVKGVLSKFAADEPDRLAWVVADAQAARVPAILSEANSASCGGVAGVSNSPATAVWAARFVLSALKAGFEEVRFHFSGNAYDPFVVRGQEVLEQPLFAALVALNQWLPVGSSLRTVTSVKGLVATSITSPAGLTSLVLDDESAHPQKLLLRAATAREQVITAAHAGVVSAQLSSTHGRIPVTVGANSVVVLSAP